MDKDDDGKVSIEEFESGLRKLGRLLFCVGYAFYVLLDVCYKLGIPLTRDEAKRVTSKFSSMKGAINYREFVRYLEYCFLPIMLQTT